MKYLTSKYEKQLSALAKTLTTDRYSKLGSLSLIETEPLGNPWPDTLRLLDPVELGWEYVPPGAA